MIEQTIKSIITYNIIKMYPSRYKIKVLLVLMILGAFNSVNAQKGNIKLPDKNVTVGNVLNAIQSQTNYKVAYSFNAIDTSAVVTLNNTTVGIKDALDKVLGNIDVRYVIYKHYIILSKTYDKAKLSSPVIIASIDKASKEPPVVVDVLAELREEQKPVSELKHEADAESNITMRYSNYRPIIYSKISNKSLPRFSIKSNILYTAAAFTPNLGFEFGITPKSSIEISGSYNSFNRKKKSLGDTKQLLHRTIKAEYRYWFCERYNRHFIGAHAFFAQYNISEHKIPMLFKKEYRYDGNAYGLGITYGYHLFLAKKWGLEFNVGAGMAYMKYDRFSCAVCDREPESKTKFYVGPTRAGVTLVFLLK